MGSLIIIVSQPFIKIRLQCIESAIQLFPERHLIKFLQYRSVEPFADAVCLRRHGFGFRVVDIIYCQIKLVIMLLYFATVLCTPVGQYVSIPVNRTIHI